MEAQQYKTGGSSLKKLTITNAENIESVDLRLICADIVYYESIYDATISCIFTVQDAIALQQSLPIIGGELLQLEFSHIGEDNENFIVETNLRVYKLADRQQPKDGLSVYNLYSCSDEILLNERASSLVKNGYSEFTASQVAEKIFLNKIHPISKKKLITREESVGLITQVFPSVSAFKAINMMCSEAQSSKNSSSNFVFFETSQGYHFTTIENLFSQEPKISYYYNIVLNDEKEEIKNYQRILSITHVEDSNILSSSLNGKFANRVLYLDPMAKKMKISSYTYSKDFDKTKHLSNDFPLLGVQQILKYTGENSETVENFISTNSISAQSEYISAADPAYKNTFIRKQEFYAKEIATIGQIKHQIINIVVPGNTSLNAGDIINLQFPIASQAIGANQSSDKFAGGSYLVTSLCHKIITTGEIVTMLECMKDSYQKPATYEVL